ncbi:sensor histidine kinase [Micromonospora robiginosa]|uniref:histidine kinase n=1 Tax=Micromonospora robiginosa TaxID=2749844 RepID=A0A7L6BC12_9ACTN|nr:HAMP domain-containing sensor histidine kinase [Micromonospora ferruginea]QLQ39474.1 HAMP domain-containing sensor histidine kinase [Micromonospora ferruginea]
MDVLPTWSQRWRFPELVAVRERSADPDDTDVLDALLDGLAQPVTAPADAVRRLVGLGEFRVAAGLWRDDALMGSLTATDRAALSAVILDGEQAALADVERRRNELVQREGRVAFSTSEPEGLRAAVGRPAELNALFDEWRGRIEKAEKARARDIRQRLAARTDDAPEWREAVEDCIKAGELTAATDILEAGPTPFPDASPFAARPRAAWPWGEWKLVQLLQWYADPGLAPAGFNVRWRPPAEDDAAAGVIDALRALRETVDRGTVTEFVRAFHILLDVPGVPHVVADEAEGFRAELCGLTDARLPRELLPDRMTLWFGPADWTPPTERSPAVWFRLDAPPSAGSGGPAVLTPQTVFELVAPDHGRARSYAARRIHLLRELCRQLDLDDLIGPDTELLFEPATFRTGVGWLLELLGVRVDGVTLDTLIYDTARHPVLLRAALDHLLGPRASRPDRITTQDLARWRADRAGVERLCARLRRGLDRRSEAVLAAAVLTGMDFGAEPFTADDLAARLLEVQVEAEADGPRRPATDLVDVDRALERLVDAGLVVVRPEDGGHRLRSAGLLSLLTTGADWAAVAGEILDRLAERFDEVLESVQTELSRQAVLHWIKNDLEALDLQIDSIRQYADVLPEEPREMWKLLAETLNRLQKARQAAGDGIRERLRAERVDLVKLLEELVAMERRYQRDAALDLDAEDGPVVVEASYFLLDQAVRNLLTNAVQQFRTRGGGRIQVRLRNLAGVAPAEGDWAVIEVHDSGPGLTAEQRERFEAGERFSSRTGGEGTGLRYARSQIDYCGGSLTLDPGRSDLGGALFLIRLPLASSSPELSRPG